MKESNRRHLEHEWRSPVPRVSSWGKPSSSVDRGQAKSHRGRSGGTLGLRGISGNDRCGVLADLVSIGST